MRVPSPSIPWTAACLSVLLLLSGCDLSDRRAKAALGEYQSAQAASDPYAARQALLKLVRAKDDVPDYWSELGKVEAQLGEYNDAYYAFTRAYELNRSDPQILRSLTELSLRSGEVALAQTHARELEVVAPGDPWIKIADGWAAFAQSRYDDAIAAADSMLTDSPYNSIAKTLKARSLLALNREDDAIKLLEGQVAVQQSDAGSYMLLAKIYDERGDWPKVVEAERHIATLVPNDRDNALLMVEAALRSGAVQDARQASFRLLQPQADPSLISSVLDLWSNYWPSAQRVADARMVAGRADGMNRKLIYADFLARAGSPGDAIKIAAASASLPVDAANAEANAVLAAALLHGGNIAGAKSRFDAVLSFDPGNATALRGRTELEIRTGNHKGAIDDAQKLVSVLPTSADDRLLLARAYSSAGNSDWAQRTLWSAFQDIPADEQIFNALRATRSGNSEALNELQGEFDRQRSQKINRGLL